MAGKAWYPDAEFLHPPHLWIFSCCGPSGFSRCTGSRPSRTPKNRSSRCTSPRAGARRVCSWSVAVGTLASYDWLMSLEPHLVFDHFRLVYSGGRRVDVLVDRDAGCDGIPARRASETRHHHRALSRSGQVDVRDDRVLHLHRVFAIHPDLVRQHSGGNASGTGIAARAAGCMSPWRCRSSVSSFRSSRCCAGRPSAAWG